MIEPPALSSPVSSAAAFSGSNPPGLYTLFFTEMWERFSYYGMRALLVLFMVDAVASGGLGLTDEVATAIYGLYTAAVYLAALPGGWVADRFVGARRAVWYGGIIIACGHFTLAVPRTECFYLGLILVVIGTGLLKPNVSAMVGELFPEGGGRRDAGFTVFYMGINLGAGLGPLVCSALGEKVNWHLGFAAAGVGMILGLIQYGVTARRLGEVGIRAEHQTLGPQRLADSDKCCRRAPFDCHVRLEWSAAIQSSTIGSIHPEPHCCCRACVLRLCLSVLFTGTIGKEAGWGNCGFVCCFGDVLVWVRTSRLFAKSFRREICPASFLPHHNPRRLVSIVGSGVHHFPRASRGRRLDKSGAPKSQSIGADQVCPWIVVARMRVPGNGRSIKHRRRGSPHLAAVVGADLLITLVWRALSQPCRAQFCHQAGPSQIGRPDDGRLVPGYFPGQSDSWPNRGQI